MNPFRRLGDVCAARNHRSPTRSLRERGCRSSSRWTPVSGATPSPFPARKPCFCGWRCRSSSHRLRQAAAGFAVEDMIAEPLDVSSRGSRPRTRAGRIPRRRGPAGGDGDLDRADRRRAARLVPDVLALPTPGRRQRLGARSQRPGARAPVRRHRLRDVRLAAFETFWRADASPQIVLFGGRLPEGVPVSASGLMPSGPTSEALGFDLMRGGYARDSGGWRKTLLRLGAVLALALAAHLAILCRRRRRRSAGSRPSARRRFAPSFSSRAPDLPPEHAARPRAAPGACPRRPRPPAAASCR